MSQIHQIEPSRVVHELILKPIGTYLIRYSTENDYIISRMNTEKEIKSNPYVVLSVRVDENKYHCSIMNYHLPFEEENSRYTIEYYRNNFKDDKLPELIEECIIKTDETDWKINHEYITQGYLQMFDSNDKYLKTEMQCDTLDGNNTINVFKKAIKNNEEEELNILRTISYFHIVTFYGITNELNQMKYLVLADNGESLKTKYPEIRFFGDLTSKQLAAIGYQIASGMMYLELKHIIHRDLHADNIFIDDYNFIRIGDFEHAIIKDDDQEFDENRDLKFKIRRLAPECLPSLPDNGELFDSNEILFSEFSSKSDVWSYGLVFIDLTLDTDESIYPELPVLSHNDANETIQIIEHVKINQRIHKRPDDCPENLYNILKRCWEYDRDKRISFENLRNQMLILFKSIHK